MDLLNAFDLFDFRNAERGSSTALENAEDRARRAEAQLRDMTAQHRTPACPRGQFEFEYDAGLSEPLVCQLEYEAAERGSRERGTGLQLEPDYPASANLCATYVGSVDILELLPQDLISVIESAFLARHESDDREPDYDEGESHPSDGDAPDNDPY